MTGLGLRRRGGSGLLPVPAAVLAGGACAASLASAAFAAAMSVFSRFTSGYCGP